MVLDKNARIAGPFGFKFPDNKELKANYDSLLIVARENGIFAIAALLNRIATMLTPKTGKHSKLYCSFRVYVYW